jgi:hypothetical protein
MSSAPDHIRPLDFKLAIQQVWGDRQLVVTISGSFKFLAALYRYAGLFHQAPGTVSAYIVAIVPKLTAHPP